MARVLRSMDGSGSIAGRAGGDMVEGESRGDLGRVAERVEDGAVALRGGEQTLGSLRVATAYDDVGPDLEPLDADLRPAVDRERSPEVRRPGHGHPHVFQL